ncbi:hypothetical protein [Rhodococcus opacus]|uniref:hypothetical protein n=1 Tax=Rhodococcus opacus TaxID=37919 RepID=UPI00211DBD2A|nr:hypothetical protein [Rhodococcus opacus]
MSNTIILDSVFDPFDVVRVIYAELALPDDPDFDDLDTDTRTVLLGMVFDLDPDDRCASSMRTGRWTRPISVSPPEPHSPITEGETP